MTTTVNSKYVALWFRDPEKPVSLTDICSDAYYQVCGYPKAEMLADGPDEAAAEFVSQSMTPRWRWALRRDIRHGDVVLYPPYAYMYVDPKLLPSNARTLAVPRWPQLALLRFQLEIHQCKESTSDK